METEIDSLVLDITVKDTSNGETSAKKISTLNRVLNNFQKNILALDTKAFKNKFSSMTTALKPFVNHLNSAKTTILALDRILRKSSLNGVSKAVSGKTKVGETNTTTSENTDGNMPNAQNGNAPKVGGNSPDGDVDTLQTLIKKYGEVYRKIDDADKKRTYFFQRFDGSNKITTQYTVDLEKQGDKLEEVAGSFNYVGQTSSEVTGGGLKSFFLSIKRIALYRLIRVALKAISQAMKEGISNITEFDASANETMSEITSSITVMKNSIGSIMMPLLQLVTPLIQGIAKAIGTVANGVSYLTAKLKGESTWLKVNTDYLKEYNKQSKLLTYDEFNTMSNTDNDTSGMFTQESVEGTGLGGILEDMEHLESIIASIGGMLVVWAGYKIVKWVMDGGLKTVAKSIGGMYKDISSMDLCIGGIGLVIQSIVDIVNWDDTTSGLQKAMNIITLICGVIAVICGMLAAFLPTGAAKIAKAIAFGSILAGSVAGIVAITQHANGGMFEGTGTLYHQAGERGAEVVATGSRGTGVTNVIQFKQAMVEALTEYNAARQDDGEYAGDLVILIDGKEFARTQVTHNADALRKNYNIELKPR